MGTSLPDPFPVHAGVVSQGWDWSTEITKQNSHRSEVPRLRILSLRSSACQMDGGSRVCVCWGKGGWEVGRERGKPDHKSEPRTQACMREAGAF